jgi:hypothetical protein
MNDQDWLEDKNWFRRHWVISIFLGLFVLGLVGTIFDTGDSDITGNVVQEKYTKTTSNTEDSKVVEEKKSENAVYGINENIKVDYLTYKITKAETFVEMGTSMFNKETSGKFIKVYLEIMNNAKETKDIFSPRFMIKDNQDREYDRLSDDMMYISDSLEFGKQLQPGLTTSGAIVFELPKDSKDLKLVISGDWLSATEVKVALTEINDIGKDTTQQEETDEMIDDMMSQCNSPFSCSSSCSEYMDMGQKDCPSGQVCCME